MILEFEIGGFKSFNEKKTIYFTPLKNTRLKNSKFENNYYIGKKHKAMKSSVILGDNGSGKSNLLEGIKFLKNMITIVNDSGEIIGNDKLNKKSKNVYFRIDVLTKDDTFFSYEIKFNQQNIIKETLKKENDLIYTFDSSDLKKENRVHIGEKATITKERRIYDSKIIDGDEAGKLEIYQPVIFKLNMSKNIKEIGMFLDEIRNITVDTGKTEDIYKITEKQKINLEKNEEFIIGILKNLDESISGIGFLNFSDDTFEILIRREDIQYKNISYPMNEIEKRVKEIELYKIWIEALEQREKVITMFKEVALGEEKIESYDKKIESYDKGIESCKKKIELCMQDVSTCYKEIDPYIEEIKNTEYEEKLEKELKDKVIKYYKDEDKNIFKNLILSRPDMDNRHIKLESTGIRKIINLFEELIKFKEGGVLLVDELDSSISTRGLLITITDFINIEENKKGQLIMSSHNSAIIDDVFKAEQIYIVEKNAKTLESEITALSDFKKIDKVQNRSDTYIGGGFKL